MSEKMSDAPRMCLACKAFYGSPANDNLCSVCFSKSKKLEKKEDVSGD